MADLFAMTRDDEFRRLQIERGLQDQLSDMFLQASGQFTSDDLEVVPFGRFAFEPDETQVWTIEEFELPQHLRGAVQEPLACPALAAGDAIGIGLKAVVASFPDDGALVFQVIDRRRVLEPRGLTMILDDGTFRRIREPGLQLSDKAHVILQGQELRFRSAYWARRVFDISTFYIEATEEEVDAWIARDDLAFECDVDVYRERMSQWERKRIGFILSSGILEQVDVPVIRERAREYGLDLGIAEDGAEERLIIPENATERRDLIKFLEEDYYRGPLTNSPFVANSKKPL